MPLPDLQHVLSINHRITAARSPCPLQDAFVSFPARSLHAVDGPSADTYLHAGHLVDKFTCLLAHQSHNLLSNSGCLVAQHAAGN